MRKLSIITLIVITVLFSFMPFYKVEAATPYTVEMVSNTRGNEVVGSYSSYDEAVKAMKSQNSSSTSVATVYKDGRAVDSEYAIFKFKPGNTYNLYRESNSSSAYTYVHGSYGVDAAFLGYSENGRVKIMISGFTGWTDINNGVITPISLLGVNGNMISVPGNKGIRIRTAPSLSASVITKVSSTTNFSYTETAQADGYTWYKVNYNGQAAWIAKTDSVLVLTGSTNLNTFYKNYGPSGNLIHYYDTYNGVGYNRAISNLGTAPSWMPKEVIYYSFDGNYFYSTLESMLDDYRNGTYEHSVNYNNPYYSYYLYLPSHSTTSYTASDLDSIIANKGYNASNSKMYGTGQYFKEAEATYGQNALMMFSHAATESAYGTSNIAMDKNNLFGYGAADSCAYDCAYSYDSPRDSIMDYAQKTGDRYNVVTGKYYYGSHFGNKSSGRNVKYMADPYAGEKEAAKSFLSDIDFGGKDFNSNTIGVTRKGLSGAWVFTRPEQVNDAYLYTLKNPTTNDPVYDIPANIVDKVVGIDGKTFYKVYTDLNPGDGPTYGYVEASEWNVSNNQPVINANDVTITEGANFDPMSGVSASDVENGDLTSKVTYESDVDSNKAGTYHVTYTVVDNSNFHASKEITVKVTSAELPTIDAENREVNQFEEFDYMTGVKATAYDGTDLTDSITYDKTVDTNVSGTYEVTYKVKDSKGKEASKTITVTVIPNEKPVINASDKEIYLNSEFDPLEGVTATDKEDGELKVEYEGEVKTDVIGNYEITYKATDKNGQVTTKTITVKVIANQLPVINASDKTIYLNSEFNPLEGVIATDEEDGKIDKIEVVKNDVKTDKEGKYEVTYSVTDSYNQTVTKTITVTVTEKVLVKKDGLFYVDYLDNVDGKLELKGYNTIKGIDNDLNQDIKYKITFKNVDNNQTYEQYATRIVDDNEIPFDVYSADGKNYKYSWFTIDFDLDKLPAGNYTATMTSIGEDYYSENVITNKTNSTEITGFNDENKYLVIRNNYNYNSSPIEFIVRDEKLADKTVSSYYNQFDNFITFEFNDDNTLHLRGMSYSYGMNLSSSANVTRKIIFENENNYKTYVKDLGSVTNGDYEAPLPVSDGLDKTRAWYDKNIDISDIPKGTYAIYITTSANVTDISEFTEKLGRSLDDVKATINGKKYSFDVNFSKNSRIEMKVE